MRQIEMTIYTKNGATWTQGRTTTDETEIYKSLAADLLHKKSISVVILKALKTLVIMTAQETLQFTMITALKRFTP